MTRNRLQPSTVSITRLSCLVLCVLAVQVRLEPVSAQTTPLTYENWAQGFFTKNCLPCHHSDLSGDERFGAPADINFDNLQLIKDWAFEIGDVATGDNPSMPPTGVVWWWDRLSLQEWLTAGMPGQTDSLHSVEIEPTEISLSYDPVEFHFSGPIDDYPNIRSVTYGPPWEEEFEGLRTWRSVYLYLDPGGGVFIAGRQWETRNDDWSTQQYRLLEYTPPIPLLGTEPDDEYGQSTVVTVSVRERRWNGWRGGTPVLDATSSEQWRVTNAGLETIDNAVIAPPTTLKMVLANLTHGTTETFWFQKGMGIMRREFETPSDTYIREVTREMNTVTREYPLYGPFIVESASQEYLPLYSRWWDGEGTNWGYSYECEVQKVAIVKDDSGTAPTPTNTLAPDPTNTYPGEDPTPTPFPSGLPSPQPTFTPTESGSTETPTPTPTPTPTDTPVSVPTPTPTRDMDSPATFDFDGDNKVSFQDLLMFLRHWQEEMEE